MPVRILVADDHRLFAECVGLTLELDPRVTVVGFAADGVEAIDQTRRLRPDVVLMDLQMPRLDGVEATRRLRLLSPGVRVVAMSGAAPPALVRLAHEAGAVRFVGKDEPASVLTAAVVGAVAETRELRPTG